MTNGNIQDNNVGNRGDVLKHVSLVALAKLLRLRNPGLVRHVETHAFRLTAPLVRAVDAPVGDYAELEKPWVAKGLYRCSAGLVADALGPPVKLLLAEADPATRAVLAEQIAAEGLDVEALVEDAMLLAKVPPGEPAPLLIHVDPFDHPMRYWPLVQHLLRTWRRPDQDAVVVAFAYDREGSVAWPPPPGDLLPIGRNEEYPYGVSAWASPAIAALGPE